MAACEVIRLRSYFLVDTLSAQQYAHFLFRSHYEARRADIVSFSFIIFSDNQDSKAPQHRSLAVLSSGTSDVEIRGPCNSKVARRAGDVLVGKESEGMRRLIRCSSGTILQVIRRCE